MIDDIEGVVFEACDEQEAILLAIQLLWLGTGSIVEMDLDA